LPSRPGRDQAGQPRRLGLTAWSADPGRHCFPDPACGPLLARAPVVWSSLIFCCLPGVFAMARPRRALGWRSCCLPGEGPSALYGACRGEPSL